VILPTSDNGDVMTPESIASEIKSSNLNIFIYFWAPWCGPCKMMSPNIDYIENFFGNRIRIIRCNVDESPEIAEYFGVSSIPIFKCVTGKEQPALSGFQNKNLLMDFVNSQPKSEKIPTDAEVKYIPPDDSEEAPLLQSISNICESYLGIISHFSNACKNNGGELRESNIKNYDPNTGINKASEIYSSEFIPLVLQHYLHLHSINKSSWSTEDLNSRFIETYRPFLDTAICPILQTALSHDIAEYYSIQAQIASIQQDDPDIAGMAIRGFTLFHGNVLAAPGLLSSFADLFGVGPKSDRLEALLEMDEKSADIISKRCVALFDTIVGIVERWENSVDEEIKISIAMRNQLAEIESEKEKCSKLQDTIAKLKKKIKNVPAEPAQLRESISRPPSTEDSHQVESQSVDCRIKALNTMLAQANARLWKFSLVAAIATFAICAAIWAIFLR
jgi:thioredoxin 1